MPMTWCVLTGQQWRNWTAALWVEITFDGADEAQVLLSYGFINTLVDDLRLAELRDYLKTFLAEYFSAEYEDQARLVRHLK